MILLHPFESLINCLDSKLNNLCDNDMEVMWLWAEYYRLVQTVAKVLCSRGRKKTNMTRSIVREVAYHLN
jgi:hypothetical protein